MRDRRRRRVDGAGRRGGGDKLESHGGQSLLACGWCSEAEGQSQAWTLPHLHCAMAAGAEPSLQILGREDVPPIDLAPAPEDDAHMLLLKRAAGFGDVRCVAPVLHPTLARFVVNASDGEKMYERLDEALRLLDVCNVEHWLCAGTLLGQCRHGGIIPWDDDARPPAPRSRRRAAERRAQVDLAVGPLDAPRLGEALAAHLPDAGWAFERTFYGYKMWKGDRCAWSMRRRFIWNA